MKVLRLHLVLASAALLLAPTGSRAQEPVDLDLGDEVNYPWTLSTTEGGYGSGSAGDQSSRVLTVPVSIWLRRLTDGRKLGLRLRVTGVIGYQDFERLKEFNVGSIRLGGLFPGIEFLIPLGDRSMLRPFADIGVGLTNTEIGELLLTTFGLRTEFVTVGFREQAPKIWFVRVPRLGVGYRFGDGLTGLRIRIGGDRVTRLPLP